MVEFSLREDGREILEVAVNACGGIARLAQKIRDAGVKLSATANTRCGVHVDTKHSVVVRCELIR